MRALFVSDTHGKKLEIVDVDVIFHSGDFTMFEKNIVDLLLYFESLNVPFFLIHGNHETTRVEKIIERLNLSNVKYIHNRVVEFNGLTIAGIGGGGFSYNYPTTKQIEKQLKGKKLHILLTHAPPYGTKLDRLNFNYVGNMEFRQFIEKYQPLICSCGHLHENAGKVDFIKATKLINPGFKGMIIELKP